MKSRWYWLALVWCPLLLVETPARTSAPPPRPVPHRSPCDVALVTEGRLAVTANHTSDSVSLVDLQEGKVVAELPVGRKPAGVACSPDGSRAVVSNLWSDTVTLLEIGSAQLRWLGEIEVGHLPRGVVFGRDGKSFFVALSGADEVAQVEWSSRKVVRRLQTSREPRRLAVTRDGKTLLAACSRSAQVRCWDISTGKVQWEQTILEAFNLLGLCLTPDDSQVVLAHVHHRHHPLVKNTIEQGWALNSRLSQLAVRGGKPGSYSQIALDVRNKAVGDPSAVAFSSRGDRLVVAAGGTQELLLIQPRAIPWVPGDPGDFLDGALNADDGTLHRLSVGGRPLAVQFVADSDRVVVANYLLDAVQIVDAKAAKMVSTISLGGPETASPARRGEAIFYDAKRSHHQWFSCHTCHTEGHTSGRLFDTLNDDALNTAKMTPTLRGVTKTGPWTWHGWQKSLADSVEKSLTETLWGPDPTPEEVQAVVAFLETLDHPRNPYLSREGKRTAAQERGKALFHGKARCVRCHQGEYYTSKNNYDVKLPPDGSSYDKWNPPSLRGVYDRGPFLHSGEVETLEELIRFKHAPEKLGGEALTPAERRDLVEFVKSL